LAYLKGPILIFDQLHSSLLNHVAGTDKVSFKPPPQPHPSGLDPEELKLEFENVEPWSGSQVWLLHPHVGGKFTIKSYY
jgi:hypothetical protein